MSTNIQKFNLSQGGKNYILTSQIEGENVKLTCVESEVQNPPIYIGFFSLIQLRQMSKIFNSMTTIFEAQTFFNQTIEKQKVSVQNKGTLINIIIYFQRETEVENVITTDYNTQAVNYNTQQIEYNTVEQQDYNIQIPVTTTTTETVENTYNYLPETNYVENQTYENNYDLNLNNYQTYETTETTNTNYDYNYNYDLNNLNTVNVQQTQENTYTTTEVQSPQVETLTLPLAPSPVDENKYLLEIEQLKNEIKLLREENYTLKQKTVITTTTDQSGEILLLKQEIERLKLQLEELLKQKQRLE